MIFHWTDDKGKVYHTREIPFGHKLVGLTYKNIRPDYVTITHEENCNHKLLYTDIKDQFNYATNLKRVLKFSAENKSRIFIECLY